MFVVVKTPADGSQKVLLLSDDVYGRERMDSKELRQREGHVVVVSVG